MAYPGQKIFAGAYLLAFLCTHISYAAVSVWRNNAGNTVWNDAQSWNGQAPGAGDTARFNGDPVQASPNLTATTTIQGFDYTAGAGAYTFSSNAGQILTIGTDGIINGSAQTQTFSAQLALGGGISLGRQLREIFRLVVAVVDWTWEPMR